jgi:WD40 repeat protein
MEAGANVLRVTVSTDGKRIATLTEQGTLNVWDADTGRLIGEMPLSRSTNHALTLDSRGQRLLWVVENGATTLWEQSARRELGTLFESRSIGNGAFSADGRWVAASSVDRTAVWQADNLQRIADLEIVATNLAFSPDGHFLAALTPSTELTVFDGDAGMRSIDATRSLESARATMSQDGRRLFTADDHSSGFLWDLDSGRLIANFYDLAAKS